MFDMARRYADRLPPQVTRIYWTVRDQRKGGEAVASLNGVLDMSDIAKCLAAFSLLSNDERDRSLRLIGAYNAAIAETRADGSRSDGNPFRLFSASEIERLVSDFGDSKLSNIGPAMARYLLLLKRGYRLPALW